MKKIANQGGVQAPIGGKGSAIWPNKHGLVDFSESRVATLTHAHGVHQSSALDVNLLDACALRSGGVSWIIT